MNPAPGNSLLVERPPATAAWSRLRWFKFIALIFTAQVILLFLLGEKKPVVPRIVAQVPTVRLAAANDELLALSDPTLFALPHQRDLAMAGCLNMPDFKPPSFRWTEPPRWLTLSTDGLGAAFGEFLQTNNFAGYTPDFKPVPELNRPSLPVEIPSAAKSTLRLEGELADRQLPMPIDLPSWPYGDVLAPCVVQVLVDTDGNVVSSVILSPSGYDVADQRALEISRTLPFKPATHPTVGKIIFNWHTVPPLTTTNGHE